ncbi:MAG: selenide, water dikinase [Phycisphaerae bacterium]|nr:MAG: selenide, water dikinase [Phycisphaerae bacterium]
MELTAQVVRSLPKQSHSKVLAGLDPFEDAGVYQLDGETALVQTVDFFPPLVDDPFTFGQIAAANSLSDVYAMGATPISALNIVGYPDKDLPSDILCEILRGGADKVAEAGAALLGGHSVRDAEIKYGLAVTGTVHPDRIICNNTAKPGDMLVLTKPIGSGVLTSAAKSDKIPQENLAEAIAAMTCLNRGACEAMVEVGVHAATDVTGFGLLGHAFEMANGSGVSIMLRANDVPLLQDTLEFAAQGIVTRAHKASLEYLSNRLSADGIDQTLVNVLADAQTSGGLLIAVAAEKADALIDALNQKNTPTAAIIGEVNPASDQTIVLK